MKVVNCTYRIFALTMAFLMLFSSVGFSIDMHFCQGKLKSFSLLGKAKNCHELAQKMKGCAHHQNMVTDTKESCSKDMKDCCTSKTLQFQSDQDQISQTSHFLVSNKQVQDFIAAFVLVFYQNTHIEERIPAFINYQAPLISRDISVLYQSFLI